MLRARASQSAIRLLLALCSARLSLKAGRNRLCKSPLRSSPKSRLSVFAGVEDYQVALATYRAACERWPGIPITLRHPRRTTFFIGGGAGGCTL